MTSFKYLLQFVKERPLSVISWKLYTRLFTTIIPNFDQWKTLIAHNSGIEIGGPSHMFASKGFFPIYPIIKSLDGVNFSTSTIWEGELKEGHGFTFDGRKGYQYIAEGTDLQNIEENKYDFLLSCNNLEHIANPLKAIFEWKRIIKPNGFMILILPKKESNFDCNRAVTDFIHIEQDYSNGVQEHDLTHLDEVLTLHNLNRDPHAGSFNEFKKRAEANFLTRAMHHHVFDLNLLMQMIEFVGMKTAVTYTSPTDYFIGAIK